MMERRIPCRLTMTSDAGCFVVRAAAFLLLLGGLWSGRGGAVGVAALRLLELKVPEKAELNDNVTLECSFDLGNNGAHLYCVKWYKDGHEFFRFTPDDDPPTKLFPHKGITVDKERLSMTSVGLKNLGWGSSGSYRCEVSTEAPNFETVVSSAVMNVIALPKEDPMAEGFQSAYSVGDMVSGNCTSSKSNPASTLVWFINGKEVDRFSLVYYSPWPDQNGLLTSRLGLSFRVEASHFREAPPTPSHPNSRRRLELRCSANFRDQMRHRVVNTTLNAPPSLSDQRPAKHEGARGGAAKTALSPAIGTALLAFLVASMQASRFLTYTRSGYLPCVSVNLS